MLIIPAHAKVNLCLAVRDRRPDGFHEIDSVSVTIDWHDLVGIRLFAAERTVVRLHLAGAADSLVPVGDENLTVRAASAVAALAGPFGAEVWLEKRVPTAAGLGGGSADAAAVLRGCAALLGGLGASSRDALTDPALAGLASSLGSDVPMLLRGGAQRMRGRGERLDAVAAPPLHLVIAVAGDSSTAATFAVVQRKDFEDSARPERVAAALEAGDAPAADLLGSGLEAAACRVNPQLEERLAALRAAFPGTRWHLTGSGGAAFALVDGPAHARQLAAAVHKVGFPARACRTIGG